MPKTKGEMLLDAWVHRNYIERKLFVIREYLRLCEFQGLPPLHCVVSRLAAQIRAYRTEYKFFDCV